MKRFSAFAMPLLLSGCTMDVTPEEHDFFYRGWMRPKKGSQERMYGRKNAAFDPADTARHPAPDAAREPPR